MSVDSSTSLVTHPSDLPGPSSPFSSSPLSSCSSSVCSSFERKYDDQPTIDMVQWDHLCLRAQALYQASSATLGDVLSGGFNVVRPIFLNDGPSTKIVARVPRVPPTDGVLTTESYERIRERIESEVATMRFINEHTNIPTPRVLESNLEYKGGGIGLPYMLLTYAEGDPLYKSWTSMSDEERKEVLRQLVKVYQELWRHRFSNVGSLFPPDCDAHDGYTVGKPIHSPDLTPYIPSFTRALEKCTQSTSQREFWLSAADELLHDLREKDFGSEHKIREYALVWRMLSFIPTLYQPSESTSHLNEPFLSRGFRLLHGDIALQNIFVVGTKITSILDWEFSATFVPSTFARVPSFIEEIPDLPLDHDYAVRSDRDRSSFFQCVRDESSKSITGVANSGFSLHDAFNIPKPVQIIEQTLQFKLDYFRLCQFFEHMFNIDNTVMEYEEIMEFIREEIIAPLIRERGELWSVVLDFEADKRILEEAQEIIGRNDIPTPLSFIQRATAGPGPTPIPLSRTDFIRTLSNHSEILSENLRNWLHGCSK